jgi:hypothetical protein
MSPSPHRSVGYSWRFGPGSPPPQSVRSRADASPLPASLANRLRLPHGKWLRKQWKRSLTRKWNTQISPWRSTASRPMWVAPSWSNGSASRHAKQLKQCLKTAPDIKSPPDKFAVEIMLSAMGGAMRSLLESGPTPATVRKSREQLVLLCQSYMAAATAKRV